MILDRSGSMCGLERDTSGGYNSDHEGTVLQYRVLADTVCEMRESAAPISGGWKKRIDDDYKKRRKSH